MNVASILIGAAVIAYAAWVLIRHMQNMRKGKCSGCPYAGSCGKDHDNCKK